MKCGDRYAQEFVKIEIELSPEGKEWVRNTMRGLQDKMMEEIKKDPSIVLDFERFRNMAFETHSDAYLEGGLASLGFGDIWEIGNLPEAKEWMDWRTWKEVGDVVPRYIEEKLK